MRHKYVAITISRQVASERGRPVLCRRVRPAPARVRCALHVVAVGIMIGGCTAETTAYRRLPEIASLPLVPPPPCWGEPVDYNAWLIALCGRGKLPEDMQLYDGFWRWSSRSAVGLPDPPEKLRESLVKGVAGPAWRADEHKALATYLSRVSKPMGVFEKATDSPRYWVRTVVDEVGARSPVSLILPQSASSVQAACITLVQSWCEGADQGARMLAAWRRCLTHASHLESNPFLLLVRRGYEVRSLCCRAVCAAAVTDLLDADACRRASTALEEFDLDPNVVQGALLAEWAASLGILQELYPGGSLSEKAPNMIAGLDYAQLSQSGVRPGVLAGQVDAYYSEALLLARHRVDVQAWHAAEKLDMTDDAKALSGHPLKRVLLRRTAPIFLNAIRAIASGRAARIALLLRLYRLSHPDWPASLSDLGLSADDELLRDPFGPREFVYKPGVGSPRLYSVAENGVDDGGRAGDWGYLSEPGRETDFVFLK